MRSKVATRILKDTPNKIKNKVRVSTNIWLFVDRHFLSITVILFVLGIILVCISALHVKYVQTV